jgi:hypothetical protein
MVVTPYHSFLRITYERVQIRKVDFSILVFLLARSGKNVRLFESFGAHTLVCDGNSGMECS